MGRPASELRDAWRSFRSDRTEHFTAPLWGARGFWRLNQDYARCGGLVLGYYPAAPPGRFWRGTFNEALSVKVQVRMLGMTVLITV